MKKKILNKLLGMSGVPQVLDSFFDWEHYFYCRINYAW